MNARNVFALLFAVAALAPAAPAALAADSPFSPIPQAPPEQTAPAQTSSSTSSDDGLGRSQEILIGIAGFALLFAIGYAIVRDARRAAPAAAHDPLETGERVKGTRAPKDKRVAQGRAKAKAARQARRRNRP